MSSKCSAELLELALTGSLPAVGEELLHRHLEECEACSAAIEQMAGGETWCREAASLLITPSGLFRTEKLAAAS